MGTAVDTAPAMSTAVQSRERRNSATFQRQGEGGTLPEKSEIVVE
jgi:hypothetical protein